MNNGVELRFFEALEETLRQAVQTNWLIVLIMAVVIYLLPGDLEMLTIVGTGFVLGTTTVFPIISEILTSLLPEGSWLHRSLTAHTFWWLLIIGIICAALLYSLYKSMVFLAGLLAGTLLTYHFFSTFGQIGFETRDIIILGLVAGILMGILAVRKSSIFVGLVGLALASFVLSYIFIENFLNKIFVPSQTVRQIILVGMSLVLFFLRFSTWRKK